MGATVDFGFLCDHAFLDQHQRLCAVGITQVIALPRVPMTVREIAFVARIRMEEGREAQASLRMFQPDGSPGVPDEPGFMEMEFVSGYLIARMREWR